MFSFKDLSIQLLLSVILTVLALVAALTFSIEEPLYTGENWAIVFTAAFNALWLIPYLSYYLIKKRKDNLKKALILYSAFTLPWLIYRFYKPPFDPARWKAEINENYTYAGVPAHWNGAMMQDLIESRRLVGMSREDVFKLLGTQYYLDTLISKGDTVFEYFYQGGKLFDGCDKLCVYFNAGRCSSADFCGCD